LINIDYGKFIRRQETTGEEKDSLLDNQSYHSLNTKE